MPRRVRLIVFLGVIGMLVLATGISAGAAPEDEIASKEAEISAAQERLMEIRMEAGIAHEEYNNALFQMNELNEKIADAEKDLQASEEDLKEAQASLEERAAQVYKSGNVAFIDVLVGVDDFSQFASRLDLWMRLLEQERAAYESVLTAKQDLEERKSELETERARRVEAVDEAMNHKKQSAEAEAEAEDYLNSLNADLQGAIQAEQQRQSEELARQAAEAAKEAAAAEEAAAANQPPAPEPVQVTAPDLEAQQAAAERKAAAQAAAEEADLQAELAAEEAAAAEKAALAEQREQERAEKQAAAQAAREEADRQAELAAIEQAAAEQAAAEEQAAERAAERRAAQRAEERQAAREAAAAEELAAQREAERAAKREDLAAQREEAREAAAAEELAAQREEEREELRAQRAEERALEEASASAEAAEEEKDEDAASASASAEAEEDGASASASASAPASRSSGGGVTGWCGDDFGGVVPYVAEAGCDLQDRFGLRVTGVGYSSFHWDGMDLDVWTTDVPLGNQVRDYALANYDVLYTCWQDQYVNYVDGYEEPCPGHMDHVHITFQ